MASMVTAEEKITGGHLECSICTGRFRKPKVLDCLHSFCLQCLQELPVTQNLTPDCTMLNCPLCRCETELPRSGVANLPNDFRLSALVDEATVQEMLAKSQRTAIGCQGCEEQAQAVSFCTECKHFICQKCQRAHERFKKIRSHKIYTLSQLQSGEITYKSKLRDEIPTCDKHPDQNLNIYCSTCNQLICVTCKIINHEKHFILDPHKAGKRCKDKIQKMFALAEKRKAKLSTMINKSNKSYKRLDATFTDTKKKISQKADEEVAKISAEEAKFLRITESIYKDRVGKFETLQASNSNKLTQIQQKLEVVNQLVTQASWYEILEFHHKISQNLNELIMKQPETVPDNLSIVDFAESQGQGQRGRLVTEKQQFSRSLEWKLKTEIRAATTCTCTCTLFTEVAVFSNNSLVATTDGKHLLRSSLPMKDEPSSPPTVQELHIDGLRQVHSMAVNKDDQLILLDQRTVKVFNNQLQILHQFIPKPAQRTQPTCLAVDSNNLIAVGYRDSQEISLHNPDGSHIKRLYAPMIDIYLTAYKQQLIYTHLMMEHTLFFTSYDGKVFSVDIARHVDGVKYPTGVCCGRNGNIFIAVRHLCLTNDSNITGDILKYNPDRQYFRYVIRGCTFPCGITLTPHGDLVVAGKGSISIYHKE